MQSLAWSSQTWWVWASSARTTLGYTPYWFGEGVESQLLQNSSYLPFRVPTTGGEFSPPLQQFIPTAQVQSLFAQFGKVPGLLPPSCSLGVWSWCQSLSVMCLWPQKKALVSGVLPASLGPYLPHHLSLFSPHQRNPLPSHIQPFNCKSRPFVGDHKAATPFIYRLGWGWEGAKGQAATRGTVLGAAAYRYIF